MKYFILFISLCCHTALFAQIANESNTEMIDPDIEKNMFFPSITPLREGALSTTETAPMRHFTLVGLMHKEQWSAMLSLRNPDDARWVYPGERIGEIRVLAIGPKHATFVVGRNTIELRLGQSTQQVWTQRHIYQEHGRFIGTAQIGEQVYALGIMDNGELPVYWYAGDVLPIGTITGIQNDALQYTRDGLTRTLHIGQNTKDLTLP